MADQVRQRQGQRQADQERFTAGQRARVARHIALPAVDDVQLQLARGLAPQHIALVQARQVLVGQLQQVVQRQPLRKLAELVALGRADQGVQALPQLAVLRLGGDLRQQGLLVLAVTVIVFQAGARGAELLGLGAALQLQGLQLVQHGLGRLVRQGLGLQLRLLRQRLGPPGGCRLHGVRQRALPLLQAQAFGLGQAGLLEGLHIGKRAGLQGLQPGAVGLGHGGLLGLHGALGLGDPALQLGQVLGLRGNRRGAIGQGGGQRGRVWRWRCQGRGHGARSAACLPLGRGGLGLGTGLLLQRPARAQLLQLLPAVLPALPGVLQGVQPGGGGGRVGQVLAVVCQAGLQLCLQRGQGVGLLLHSLLCLLHPLLRCVQALLQAVVLVGRVVPCLGRLVVGGRGGVQRPLAVLGLLQRVLHRVGLAVRLGQCLGPRAGLLPVAGRALGRVQGLPGGGAARAGGVQLLELVVQP